MDQPNTTTNTSGVPTGELMVPQNPSSGLDFNDAPDQLDLDGYTQADLSRIANALGKASRSGNGYSCLCPVHNDHHPSGYISLGEGGKLLACCYAGCDSWDVVSKIHELGLLVKGNPHLSLPFLADQAKTINVDRKAQDWDKQGKIDKIWRETKSAQGTCVETYLKARFLSSLPVSDALRFHPSVYHGETKSQYRAMVAKVSFWGDNERMAVHQTFLKDDGTAKALIDPDKKMLGSIKGGAVQLFEAGELLGVGEGIETLLSLHFLCGIPVWAALSCTNMAPKTEPLKLPSLPLAKKLIIAIDNDSEDQSLKAAKILKQRAENEGREVFIVRPPLGIKDFNDVLKGYVGKDVDARTLIESVDGKNIDFLFRNALNDGTAGTNQSIGEAANTATIPDQIDDPQDGARSNESTESPEEIKPVTEKIEEATDPWEYALDLLNNSRKNLFITGAAGVGKSTLVQMFRTQTHQKMAVVAPTGVAALNVDGQTLHKFFNFSSEVTPDQVFKNAPLSKKDKALYEQLEILIIDEISMVRADMLDCVNLFLKKNGRCPDRPFGGVRVIMIGDPYQLAPITKREEELYLHKLGYATPYFFSAYCYNNIECVELTKIYRQKDEAFIGLLNRVRNKTTTEEDLAVLNARVTDEEAFLQEAPAIYLTTTNKKVDALNQEKLDLLEGNTFTCRGEVSGHFKPSEYPAPIELSLKKGARIMMLNNDSNGRWVNGTLGDIEELEENGVFVKIDGSVYPLEPHTWEIGERYLDGDDLKTRNVRTFKQYPLKLAWAITIHKSQGKTFDRAVIDLGQYAFAEGQTYVALSRCTSLEGICLKMPLNMRHILVDWRVTDFLTKAKAQGQIEEPEALPVAEEVNAENSTQTNALPFVAESGSKPTASSYVCLPTGTGSDVDLARHLLHNELKTRYGQIAYGDGGFWHYGSTSTHWDELDYETLSGVLHDYDGKKWINDAGEEKTLIIGENKVKNTLKRLRSEGINSMGQDRKFFNNRSLSPTGINCLNGFIKIDSQGNYELIPHHPNHRQRFTLPFHFNKDLLKSILNDQCSIWRESLLRKFLFGCFKGDEDAFEKAYFIMQLAGVIAANYSLRLKLPKAILLYGESADNGKSQVLDLFKKLLSEDDSCSVDPEKFNDEKRRLELRKSKLNAVYELSGKALESHYTKHLITGDPVDARELYKMPVDFICSAQHVWASNKLPTFYGGMDKGVQRRLGGLVFNRVIPNDEKIVGINQKIAEEEGELLLAFAVCGIQEIMSKGDFEFPPSSLAMMEQWKGEADPVLGWLQDHVLVDGSQLFTPSQDIYDHFIECARRSGLRMDRVPAMKGVIQRIKNNFPSKVKEERQRVNGAPSRGLKGLTLLPLAERNTTSPQSFTKWK